VSFELARQVADAVLFEGYVLYPYRASAQKNQARWQFGVLVPPGWAAAEAGGSEPSAQQTECLVEAGEEPALHVKVRFLQVQARTVEAAVGGGFRRAGSLEVDGEPLVGWDEGVEREVDAVALVGRLAAEQAQPFALPGGEEVEPVRDRAGRLVGRVVRRRWPVAGLLRVAAERLDGPYGLLRVRVRVENTTEWTPGGSGGLKGSPPVDRGSGGLKQRSGSPPVNREQALRRSLVACHTLLAVSGGRFVSLLEPPEWAAPAAAACRNEHTWPVLVGDPDRRDVMLSSPIILYDHPVVAPESPGDLFDATEIDEILSLRTMALTDQEKREARGTDPRAAAIVDRVDAMPAEVLERLHGAVRYLRGAPAGGAPGTGGAPEPVPWWDPGADASVSPATDSVRIGPVAVARGSRVRLRPGSRRADAQDMFLDGRLAEVQAVLTDVDDRPYLAVTLADDPAADLHQWHGRFLYFAPDEVEPVAAEQGGPPR
jgi:hypothetical protein